MSTITREFTKEQLIEKLKHRISVASGFPQSEKAQMDLELARIALASLEAEPAIHRWRRVTVEPYGPYPWHYGNFIGFSKPVEGIEDEYFYSSPPAPVSVPDFGALTKCIVHRLVDYGAADDDAIASAEEFVYNACRAAMLQGADGNSPDGWVACSERMPDSGTEIFYFCQDDGLRDCGIVSSANFSDKGDAQLYVHAEGYDLRFGVDITHRMPLPAAPQQEDTNEE
ncbi:DUF551 domain-containing protein [Enterobacter kobei]|nr:DUF551 domain-containing protein [Enterobacter kobei]